MKLYHQSCLMEEKTFFMKKIWDTRKIVLSIMLFVIEFFLTIASYQFSKSDWIFINHGNNSTVSNIKNKYKIFEYSYLKKIVSLKKILLWTSATENFTFIIENTRVVENIFPKEISHDLWTFNHFWKIGEEW